jgi:hypothetical protein
VTQAGNPRRPGNDGGRGNVFGKEHGRGDRGTVGFSSLSHGKGTQAGGTFIIYFSMPKRNLKPHPNQKSYDKRRAGDKRPLQLHRVIDFPEVFYFESGWV